MEMRASDDGFCIMLTYVTEKKRLDLDYTECCYLLFLIETQGSPLDFGVNFMRLWVLNLTLVQHFIRRQTDSQNV
ncbi:hypothetical protein EPI10_016504 [Gossypium australe]|uniref:Uncharacterized protein n=1 Tax=Gossypium australe TaxID=47621 RepID=A0A5B6VNX3_9ROSI|nr:hypothetical protein EPI10_016504 [Gossypium australe]